MAINDAEFKTTPDPISPAQALKRAIDLETEAAGLPEGGGKNALLEQAQSLRALADATDLTPP
jgi:hypothetical protein